MLRLKRVRHEGPIYRIVHLGRVTLDGLRSGERPVLFSHGAGVDSFWTLLQLFLSPEPYFRDLRRRLALIIHADLGAEWSETTAHLYGVQIPFLREHGYDLTIIRPRQTARDGQVYEDITSYYLAQAAIPTKARRSCTPRFKIGPCMAAARDILGTADFETVINFEAGETHRTKRLLELPEAERERLQSTLIHPPMAAGRFREDMKREIAALGFPVPPKSACFWCIFSKVRDIERLDDLHPDLLERAIALEEHVHAVRGRADITLLHKPLRQIRAAYRARKEVAAAGLTIGRGGQLQIGALSGTD